jgi:NAD(P)H-hydrate repair Nnr-like enzyme with NAD(P)H-hydrate dehydratase domain
VVLKGRKDIILGRKSFICDLEGGRKRCGGIGDILAGVTGVCTFWDEDLGPILASKITK